MANIVTFDLKLPRWDQNLQFTQSETTSIFVTSKWEPFPSPRERAPEGRELNNSAGLMAMT